MNIEFDFINEEFNTQYAHITNAIKCLSPLKE